MLNTSVSSSEHVVQDEVVRYPIGFNFFFNGNNTPQIRVIIGAMIAEQNVHYKFSEDLSTIILIPLEEEKPADPNDYSWLNKWVGMQLVIERDIPFVNESDYQLGRISPEQIEKDFDLSVMRDQILAAEIAEHTEDVAEELESLHSDISDINAELATKATKTELDDYKQVANAGIDTNAKAIQKTRDDMNAKDLQLETILNGHTEQLNTLRTDHDDLGDDVDDIQAKIPQSASDSNPLITKQQLLDKENDIRNDLNQSDSELQAQITAQEGVIATKQDRLTAGDNIIISGNVISATGGGAGLDFIAVEELPETGQKGVVYLIAKDGAEPDVYDEYVWITTTETFELIGSTKVDLSGYLQLSGGTMSGNLDMVGGKIRFGGGNQSPDDPFAPQIGWKSQNVMFIGDDVLLIDTAYHTFRPSSSGIRTLGLSNYKWKNVYTQNINNGADLAVPTEGGTLARLEDLENIDALPDQTGNTGKFLKTDGTTASWEDVPPSVTITLKEYDE